jgi:hypothetical protein
VHGRLRRDAVGGGLGTVVHGVERGLRPGALGRDLRPVAADGGQGKLGPPALEQGGEHALLERVEPGGAPDRLDEGVERRGARRALGTVVPEASRPGGAQPCEGGRILARQEVERAAQPVAVGAGAAAGEAGLAHRSERAGAVGARGGGLGGCGMLRHGGIPGGAGARPRPSWLGILR